VDDLLFLGTKQMHKVIAAIRKSIEMDDPQPLSKYLGCNHHLSKKTVAGGHVVTNATFDMVDYMGQACDAYVSKTGLVLKPVDSPYAPDLPAGQLDALLALPGKHQQHSASVLMKLLYAARMAAPWLCVAISRLAKQIHKWTADCDRRLHRLYCYIYGTRQQVLTGSLSTADLQDVSVEFWCDADLNGDMMSSKSTSGRWIELKGNNGRCMPLH
jgi:hypothetical protein